MKKFSTIAILALMVVGCNNNYDNVEPTVEGTPMTIVATTADDAAEGRTALNSADGKTVVWKAGDKLGVFCEYIGTNAGAKAVHVDRYQQPYTLTSGDGTTSGVFEGTSSHVGYDESTEGVGGVYRFHAYYPISDANAKVLKGNLTGTLAAMQNYDATAEYNDMSANDLLLGRYLNGTKETNPIPLTFEHVFAMMTFEVSNPTAEPIVVNKVEMTTEEGLYLSGSYTIHATHFFSEDKAPVFNSGSASVGVSVSNGSVAAGQKINARLIFNRWAATDGKALTVKVYTDKGVQTFNKTATDFSGNNSWGLRLALDPSAMEKEIVTVDNYVAGMKELGTGSYTTQINEEGTFCVMQDFTCASSTYQIRHNLDVTIIGRNIVDGVPQQTATMTLTPAAKAEYCDNNIVVKDLIWKGSNSDGQIFRMNAAVADVNSVLIENCIIDGQNLAKQIMRFSNATYAVKSIVIKNCKFINIGNKVLNNFKYAGSAKIESFIFENNVIETTTSNTTVEAFFQTDANLKITPSYEGSTVVKVQ
ncbi:MAG: fimbrillin family protein [Tidjanibacter sp.]|nr:fimbrillin family protein [Tidjanibacter sp.]